MLIWLYMKYKQVFSFSLLFFFSKWESEDLSVTTIKEYVVYQDADEFRHSDTNMDTFYSVDTHSVEAAWSGHSLAFIKQENNKTYSINEKKHVVLWRHFINKDQYI